MNKYLVQLRQRFEKLTKRQKIVFVVIILLFLFALVVILLTPKKPVIQGKPEEQTTYPILSQFSSSIFGPVLRLMGKEQAQVKLVPSAQPSVPASSPGVPSPTPVPYNLVLDKTLNFIKSLYRPDGFYNYYPDYEKLCPTTKKKEECPLKGVQVFPTTNGWTALAYMAAYKIENKPEYLEYAKRDLDKLMEYCHTGPEALKNCLWGLTQFVDAYEVTQESRYLTYLKEAGEVLLKTYDPHPMLTNIEVRELALIGEITGEERFTKEAEKRFLETRDISAGEPYYYYLSDENGEKTYVYPYTCWNLLAGMQLYRRAGQEEKLQKIESILKKMIVPQVFNAFANPSGIQPCIEAYFILGDIKGKELYHEQAKELLKLFIDRFWEIYSIEKDQGAVFLYQKDHRKNGQMIVLTDNCYLVHLLSKMKL